MLKRLLLSTLRHPQYKLLALALAIVAWTYVQGDEVHETRIKAPIVWTLPPHLTTPEPLPNAVMLTVRGTRAATRRAREADVVLPVDISDIGVGEHALAFEDFTPRNLPQGVEVLSTSPSSVRFALDEIATRKVSLEPVLVGDPGPDHAVGEVTLEPQVVEIVGPRGVVERLREVKTAPLDVSELREDSTLDVDLDLPRSVRLANPNEAPRARVQVVPRNEARDWVVPVVVWGSYDWVVQQGEVRVSLEGSAESLRAVGAQDVIAVVHLPESPERTRFEAPFGPTEGPRLRILHPGGDRVRVARVSPARVEVVRR